MSDIQPESTVSNEAPETTTESVATDAPLKANVESSIGADNKDLNVGVTAQLSDESQVKGEGASDLLQVLPEDLRTEPSLQNFKDVGALAKSYVSAQQMIGRSVRIPSEDAGPEAMAEFYSKLDKVPGIMRAPDMDNPESLEQFYNKLGRPETADKYEVKLPEEIASDTETVNTFKEIAHKHGLTQQQINGLAEFEAMRANKAIEQSNAMKQNATQALKEKWGSDFDARLGGAKAALNHYSEAFPDAVSELANSPVGNNPVFIAMLSELGGMLQESGTLQGQQSVQYGVSAEEARSRIDEIRSNRSHAFHNPNDPNHAEAVKKVKDLYSAAFPDD